MLPSYLLWEAPCQQLTAIDRKIHLREHVYVLLLPMSTTAFSENHDQSSFRNCSFVSSGSRRIYLIFWPGVCKFGCGKTAWQTMIWKGRVSLNRSNLGDSRFGACVPPSPSRSCLSFNLRGGGNWEGGGKGKPCTVTKFRLVRFSCPACVCVNTQTGSDTVSKTHIASCQTTTSLSGHWKMYSLGLACVDLGLGGNKSGSLSPKCSGAVTQTNFIGIRRT